MNTSTTRKRPSPRYTLLSALLSALLALALLPVAALPANAAVSDTFTAANADGATITYKVLSESGSAGTVQVGTGSTSVAAIDKNYAGALDIPATVTNGGITYSVTDIAEHAFRSCGAITSVTAPDSVKSVGNYAFYDCWGLTAVTFEGPITSIGLRAFGSCGELVTLAFHKGSAPTLGSQVFFGGRASGTVYYPEGEAASYTDGRFQTARLSAGWQFAAYSVTPEPEGIDVAAGYGGAITWGDGAYTVAATVDGYVIDQVLVDGTEAAGVQGLGTWTAEDEPQQSISATFAYTISLSASDHGSLSVSRGNVKLRTGDIVRVGEVLDVTATPEAGYELDSLVLTGITENEGTGYTVTALQDEPTPAVAATFKLEKLFVEPGSLATVYLNGASGDDANDGARELAPVKTFAAAKELLDPAADGATIYVTGTVKTSGEETWSLAGFTNASVKRHSSFAQDYSTLVRVGAGSSLVLADIVVDGDNLMSSTMSGPLFVVTEDNASLTMKDGAVLKNNRTRNGGAIDIGSKETASFTMDGGSIQGCAAPSDTAVYCYSGSTSLNGGSIVVPSTGSAVYVFAGSGLPQVSIGSASLGSFVDIYHYSNAPSPLALGVSAPLTSPLGIKWQGAHAPYDGAVAAQGIGGYTLTQDDAARVSWKGTGVWAFILDDASNQVLFSEYPEHAVGVSATENGTVLPNKVKARFGDTVTFTAVPDDGYRRSAGSLAVSGASGKGIPPYPAGTDTYRFTMPDEPVTISAAFELVVYHAVTVDAAVTHGTIDTDPAEAALGQEVTLTVAPEEGYKLPAGSLKANGVPVSAWTTDATGAGTYRFTMPDGPVTVTAAFEPIVHYPVTIDSSITHGTITADVAEAEAGTRVTLTVAPEDGYWLLLGSLKANGGDVEVRASYDVGTYHFTVPTGPVTITAAFEDVFARQPSRDGDGAYQLATAADFVWFSEYVSYEHTREGGTAPDAVLVADIDLSETAFTPIGSKSPYGHLDQDAEDGYGGSFDGAGHTVTVAVEGAENRGGIFKDVGGGAIIKDLTVAGSISGNRHIGGFASCAGNPQSSLGSPATFINCVNKATVTVAERSNARVGGIIGYGNAVLEGCANYGAVSGGHSIGGIVGEMAGSTTVTGCENHGVVTNGGNSTGSYIGGIAGTAPAVTMKRCANYGAVSGNGSIGGIVGFSYNTLTSVIEGCVNEGDVSAHGTIGANIAGGIAGAIGYATVTRCVNVGAVEADNSVGGITGTANSPFTLTENYNGGTVTGTILSSASGTGIAGIVGKVDASGHLSPPLNQSPLWDNYNSGAVLCSPQSPGAAPGGLGPILGVCVPYSDTSNMLRNLYATGSAGSGYDGPVGLAVDSSNAASTGLLLRSILFTSGIADEVKYNLGGYPVPKRLWDGEGQAPEGADTGGPATVRFNVTPESAAVEVRDSEGSSVEPSASGAYVLEIGESYTYTVAAEGYVSQTDSVFIVADRLVTVALRLADPGKYVPGWGGQRPSFGIYVTNPDGMSGTRIGNWVYDDEQGTYVDEQTGEEAPFIEDFSEDPLVYSGVDMLPAARLGVVTKGIRASALIDYYNSYVAAHPALGLAMLEAENVEDFNMVCSTNSSASEDPYASNDATVPGRWPLTGWDDSLTGTVRSYYPAFVTGTNSWSGEGYKSEPLGEGVARESVLALTSYNDRVGNLPKDGSIAGFEDGTLDNQAELEAAIAYLVSVADSERALRNFTGMLPDNSTHPLGADDSYYVGSVWITAPRTDATEPPAPSVGAPASGDLDGDGSITAAEVLAVAKSVIGTSTFSEAEAAAADLDKDGALTMADVVLMMRKMMGLP
jgi:hypothetical protein